MELDRRSVHLFVAIVVGVGIALLAVPVIIGLPVEPFLLLLVYGVMLGGAVITARRSGRDGVRRLFSGALRWRIGWLKWAVVATAIPTATVAVAVATETFTAPANGWPATIAGYVFLTFVLGALILNIFEEAVWQGLVQRHLTQHHGAVKAAALTAVPFGAIHVPLSFAGGATPAQALTATALLFVFAPPLRYVLGRTDLATDGSLLAVAVMHASFNASGQLDVANGGWQHIAALVVVAIFALAVDHIDKAHHGKSHHDSTETDPVANDELPSIADPVTYVGAERPPTTHKAQQ